MGGDCLLPHLQAETHNPKEMNHAVQRNCGGRAQHRHGENPDHHSGTASRQLRVWVAPWHVPALPLALIHRSAWNRYSRKFISKILHSPSPVPLKTLLQAPRIAPVRYRLLHRWIDMRVCGCAPAANICLPQGYDPKSQAPKLRFSWG
jgi:hypothetical protein